MIKCPFCQFENEEGALFCEQCKSDLAVEPAAPSSAVSSDEPLPETIPLAEVAVAAACAEGVVPSAAALETVPAFSAGAAAAETVPAPAPAHEAAQPTTPTAAPIPVGTQLKLVVIRGLKLNTEYPLYPGLNFIGRFDEKPVDIDLVDQEPPDRVWSSRQHACISWENGVLEIEDLNSANGTFVNRARVYPGQKRQLNVNDVIQIGTVQMRVVG
jgi:hypothetical protein